MTILKSLEGLHPNSELVAGKEYLIQPSGYGDSFRINGEFISPKNLESPKERFLRLIQTASKFIVPVPSKGNTVDILQTKSYLILYSHSKGNHWNICGNHYKYFHDVYTGELILINEVTNPGEKVIWKERVLKVEALKMNSFKK